MKRALITGIGGQTGSYLAELLLSKGYEVHGLQRRTSLPNTSRIEHILDKITLHWGDMCDRESLFNVVHKSHPDEVYNLACQSHVGISFSMPEYTRATIKRGTEDLLAACTERIGKSHRIYLAASSEMFGNSPAPQNENTLLRPVSPYAMAKVDAFRFGQLHRSQLGKWIAQGICFNHESPRRGLGFVTRKITHALGRMACGLQKTCSLGNLEAKRDWGHARDTAEAIWLMMQQEDPDDYVIATGETRTVAEFLKTACMMSHSFHQIGADFSNFFKQDPALLRPAEVNHLEGDSSKARKKLGWKPRTEFHELVAEMVTADYKLALKEAAGENLRQHALS